MFTPFLVSDHKLNDNKNITNIVPKFEEENIKLLIVISSHPSENAYRYRVQKKKEK